MNERRVGISAERSCSLSDEAVLFAWLALSKEVSSASKNSGYIYWPRAADGCARPHIFNQHVAGCRAAGARMRCFAMASQFAEHEPRHLLSEPGIGPSRLVACLQDVPMKHEPLQQRCGHLRVVKGPGQGDRLRILRRKQASFFQKPARSLRGSSRDGLARH